MLQMGRGDIVNRFCACPLFVSLIIYGFLGYFITKEVNGKIYDGLGRVMKLTPAWVQLIFGRDSLWPGAVWEVIDVGLLVIAIFVIVIVSCLTPFLQLGDFPVNENTTRLKGETFRPGGQGFRPGGHGFFPGGQRFRPGGHGFRPGGQGFCTCGESSLVRGQRIWAGLQTISPIGRF